MSACIITFRKPCTKAVYIQVMFGNKFCFWGATRICMIKTTKSKIFLFNCCKFMFVDSLINFHAEGTVSYEFSHERATFNHLTHRYQPCTGSLYQLGALCWPDRSDMCALHIYDPPSSPPPSGGPGLHVVVVTAQSRGRSLRQCRLPTHSSPASGCLLTTRVVFAIVQQRSRTKQQEKDTVPRALRCTYSIGTYTPRGYHLHTTVMFDSYSPRAEHRSVCKLWRVVVALSLRVNNNNNKNNKERANESSSKWFDWKAEHCCCCCAKVPQFHSSQVLCGGGMETRRSQLVCICDQVWSVWMLKGEKEFVGFCEVLRHLVGRLGNGTVCIHVFLQNISKFRGPFLFYIWIFLFGIHYKLSKTESKNLLFKTLRGYTNFNKIMEIVATVPEQQISYANVKRLPFLRSVQCLKFSPRLEREPKNSWFINGHDLALTILCLKNRQTL